MSRPAAPRRRRSTALKFATLLRAGAILVVCVVVFFPVYWMLLSSIQPSSYSLSFPPPLLPKGFNWEAYGQLFGDKPITQICFETGFNNLSNFNRQFRSFYGVTPSEYRRHARRNATKSVQLYGIDPAFA